jgi:hypothetical protein
MLPANEEPPPATVVAALAGTAATTADPMIAIAAIAPAIFRIDSPCCGSCYITSCDANSLCLESKFLLVYCTNWHQPVGEQ